MTMARSKFLGGKVVIFAMLMSLATWAAACAGDEPPQEEIIGEQEQEVGGGGPNCKAFDENGNPNPDWPQCLEEDPTDPPDCSGYSTCYCLCRANHRCDTTPSQCGPLGQCLDECDDVFPSWCPEPGGGYPDQPQDCL